MLNLLCDLMDKHRQSAMYTMLLKTLFTTTFVYGHQRSLSQEAVHIGSN